jgi:uncharacterized protein
MIRFVLALAALLLFVPIAQAASFDCSKAGTSFEKAICDNPELSKQDEVLAQAYATALGGLSTMRRAFAATMGNRSRANTRLIRRPVWVASSRRASENSRPARCRAAIASTRSRSS